MANHATVPSDLRTAVERYERPLYLYAKRLVGSSEKARDIVQETFLRLVKVDRDQVEGKLQEWLYVVCRNRAIDVLRREKRLRPITEREHDNLPAEGESPGDAVQRTRDAQALIARVKQLPARQRDVIVMRFHHGWSYRQISAATGLSISNVGFHIHTAMKTLRRGYGAAATKKED